MWYILSKYLDKAGANMNIRETEMKILEVLWREGPLPANRLYKILEESIGWKRSTTYTVLRKCIEKGFIEREEPGFICKPLIEKSRIQEAKISDLLADFFDNSKKSFLKAFLNDESLTKSEIDDLKDLINRLK